MDATAPITPLPPAMISALASGTVSTVLLAGGTFDPPHVAHLAMAVQARDWTERSVRAAGSAWLLLVPAARSPFKATGPIASDADRTAMLLLASADVDRVAVWTDEIDRAAAAPQAASYTIDTATRLRAALDSAGGTGVGLRLLVGADQAVQFHKWREYQRLLALAEPIVLPRDPVSDGDALERAMAAGGAWTHAERAAWRARLLPVGLMPVSATQVRAGLAASATAEQKEVARRALSPAVRAYIEEHGLYR